MNWPEAFVAVGVCACFVWLIVAVVREVGKP